MTRKRTRLWLPALLLALFVLWTIGVKTIDVAAIGPEGSSVGFSTLNAAVRDAVAVHAGEASDDRVQVFAALRRWKDGFRA